MSSVLSSSVLVFDISDNGRTLTQEGVVGGWGVVGGSGGKGWEEELGGRGKRSLLGLRPFHCDGTAVLI